jgi:hypothetical protein
MDYKEFLEQRKSDQDFEKLILGTVSTAKPVPVVNGEKDEEDRDEKDEKEGAE